jgi:hypothetical protein
LANNKTRFLKGKMPFLQSVLFHAKSYDQFLVIHDVDEVLVSMDASLTVSDAFHRAVAGVVTAQTCDVVLTSHSVQGPHDDSAAHLWEAFPYRCRGGDANYDKSVAVTATANYAGLHIHDASGGCTRVRLGDGLVSIHHYTGFWRDDDGRHQQRWPTRPDCNVSSEFALSAAASDYGDGHGDLFDDGDDFHASPFYSRDDERAPDGGDDDYARHVARRGRGAS